MAASDGARTDTPAPRCASALVFVLLGAGCSDLAGGEDSLSPEWRCLDAASGLDELAPAGATQPARVEIAFIDLFQGLPLRDLDVRACLAVDSGCASPVGSAARSDDAGRVALDLYRGFDGYLEVRGEGIFSALVFLPRVRQDESFATMGLVPEANLRTFNTNFDAGIDFEKGHLVIRVADCDGRPAEDVTLETDVAGRRFYMIGGLPEFTSPRTGPFGVGGFLDIDAAGAHVVGSVTLDDGSVWTIGSATYPVRPGWVTFGDVGPRRQLAPLRPLPAGRAESD